MNYLVTLELKNGENSIKDIKQMEGLKDLTIDEEYEVVTISKKRNLYVVRVKGELNIEKLKKIQPKVYGVYSDTKISTINK